jgi:RimJ/RimL family protein N-acetyltransferase
MTPTTLWQGQRVRLRAVEAADWEQFYAWDDAEVDRAAYWIPFPRSREAVKKWAAELATAEPKDQTFRWVIEDLAGEFVGTLNTHTCEPRHGTFHYGLALRREHWRRGYASEAIRLVLAYYFRELRYQKANVEIYAFNTASLQLHLKLGFREEGRRRRMIYTGGAYHDEVLLGLTAEEFEALEAQSM